MTEFNLGLVAIAVIGFSQWLKEKLKIEGRAVEVMSFVVGVIAGGTYQIAIYPPTKPQDIFGAVLVALLMGLVPSGLYKFTGALAEKARPSDGVTLTGSSGSANVEWNLKPNGSGAIVADPTVDDMMQRHG